MTAQWYLLRQSQGQPSGPMPAEKLLTLAASGEASAGDWVWMEGMDVQITVERFLAIARTGQLPDSPAKFRPEWLSDVARNEIIERSRPKPNPDWLDEMRQASKSSPPSAKAAPRPAAPSKPSGDAPAQKGFPVDWLGDVRQDQKPSTPSATKPAPPPAAPAKQTTITDEFVIKGLPVDWLEDIRQIEESLRVSPPPTAPPQSPGVASPQPPPAPPTAGQCGFDPATGRILDPVAYKRWQKAEAQRRQEELRNQPTVAEAFLDAQRTIQESVDDDKNKPLVTSGDLEAIRKSASVQEILRRYEGYGPVMQEKLWKRLAFLVDNRKKFFKAFS